MADSGAGIDDSYFNTVPSGGFSNIGVVVNTLDSPGSLIAGKRADFNITLNRFYFFFGQNLENTHRFNDYSQNFTKTKLPVVKIGSKTIFKIMPGIESFLPKLAVRFDQITSSVNGFDLRKRR